MRSNFFAVVAVLIFVTSCTYARAEDLRDAYKPRFMAPDRATNPCSDLAQTFVELRSAIDITGGQASAAGSNAKGLGYFSPNKHFRSVEDNFIVVNRLLEPSLDEVTDIPISVDAAPSGAAKSAALELADAYQSSLKQIKQYALAAVVFERSAHGRRNAQALAYAYGGYAQSRNAHDSVMSADQARAILDGDAADVKDASRVLKLPEYHWRRACPAAPIPHSDVHDNMIAPNSVQGQGAGSTPVVVPTLTP